MSARSLVLKNHQEDVFHQNYQLLKEQIMLPSKIQLYLHHLENSYKKSAGFELKAQQTKTSKKDNEVNHIEQQAFCKLFDDLSKGEKKQFILSLIEELVNKHKAKGKIKEDQKSVAVIETLCKMETYACVIPYWSKVILKLNKKKRLVTIIHKERIINFLLRDYILRKSKGNNLQLVLQSVRQVDDPTLSKIRFLFQEEDTQDCQNIYKSMFKIIVDIQVQTIQREIYEEGKKQLYSNEDYNRVNIFLSQKNIEVFQLLIKQRKLINNNKIDQNYDNLLNKIAHSFENIKFNCSTNPKENSESQQQRNLTNFQKILSQNQLTIFKSSTSESIFKLECMIPYSSKLKKINFIEIYRNNHPNVFRLKIIEELNEETALLDQEKEDKNKYYAFYQKLQIHEKMHGQIMICRIDEVIEGRILTNQEKMKATGKTDKLITFKNIDHQANRGCFQEIEIFIQDINNEREFDFKQQKIRKLEIMGETRSQSEKSKMTILIKFCKDRSFDNNFKIDFLKGFKEMFDEIKKKEVLILNKKKGSKNQSLNEEEYDAIFTNQYDKKDLLELEFNTQRINSSDYEDQINLFLKEKKKKRSTALQEFVKEEKVKKASYLTHKYRTQPTIQKVGTIMKESFMWNEWKRGQNGKLICRNDELVEKQKSLYKSVIRKFGETLLKGNIINFSLPVIVFKKESHLQSLAKTYLYAPLHVEKAAKSGNPLERMKVTIIMMITEGALAIMAQKPFNPILGETYQGWIDGCPIYLEQISHHPPISSFYMVGRGYKKYGSMEPKISISLNSASGYNHKPNFLQFDDGTMIEYYLSGRIRIGGMIIGERTFNYEDRILSYDRKNRYFASLSFGPIEQGIFSNSSEPDDYFHGYIYEVTPEFQALFDKSETPKPHPTTEYIVKKLVYFDGIWNSSLNINGSEVLNFKTDLPYEFEEEKYPLESDSRYREDLSFLKLGDLETSQEAKERMEEIQRNDRKLRESHERK